MQISMLGLMCTWIVFLSGGKRYGQIKTAQNQSLDEINQVSHFLTMHTRERERERERERLRYTQTKLVLNPYHPSYRDSFLHRHNR